MIRAKFCELLAKSVGITTREAFFTVGLFSALDALMDAPMDILLKELPLSEDIVDALLYKEGRPGEALMCALTYERGDWDNVRFGTLTASEITTAYLDAVQWADLTKQGLAN